MAKDMLPEVNGTVQTRTKNKVRRVLQTLQVSANEQDVTGKNMVDTDDKTLPKKKQSKTVEKLKVAEKENTTVRRSKRKTAAPSTVNYAELPAVSKTTKSAARNITKAKKTAKSKKGSSTEKKIEQTKLNQTKLSFSPVVANTTVSENISKSESDNPEKHMLITSSTEITEDSGFDPSCGVSDQSPINPLNSTVILKSDVKSSVMPYYDISIITGNSPPLNYWKDLAEQRRIALETALHENELLHDQLIVLETENSQLKQLAREAENLAQALRAVID